MTGDIGSTDTRSGRTEVKDVVYPWVTVFLENKKELLGPLLERTEPSLNPSSPYIPWTVSGLGM